MLAKSGLNLRNATLADMHILAELESTSFPPDEAASLESMTKRCQHANPFFLVCFDSKAVPETPILGFVNGTCSKFDVIHHESMSSHDPAGKTLVIHSVTVSPALRRKGIGSALLRDYVHEMKQIKSLDQILLLSKGYLLSFYTSCGFRIERISPVQHGKVHINIQKYIFRFINSNNFWFHRNKLTGHLVRIKVGSK